MPKNGRIRGFLRKLFRRSSPAGAGTTEEPAAAGEPSGVSPSTPPRTGFAEPPAEGLPTSPRGGRVEPPAPEAEEESPPFEGDDAATARADETPAGLAGQTPSASKPHQPVVGPAGPPAQRSPWAAVLDEQLAPPQAEPATSPQIAEKLSRLPKALQDLAEAINAQAGLNARLQEVLADLGEPNKDLIHAMEDLSSEAQKQTDMLQSLVQQLTERRQFDAQAAGAISRLPGLMEGLQRSNSSKVELMGQIRDRWASPKDDLAKAMVRRTRIFYVLLGVIIALLGALVLTAIGGHVRGLFGY